jgi:hypothetical protein
MSEQEYRNLPYVNQSLLKQYENPYVPQEQTDENKRYAEYEAEYTVIGNIVDATMSCMDPLDKYLPIAKEPSAIVKSIMTYLYDNKLDLIEENVQSCPEEAEFDKRIKDTSKRFAAITEQGREFYEALSSGKIPVAQELFNTAEQICMNFYSKASTNQFLDEGADIHQAVVVGRMNMNGVMCKCMIDRLKFDKRTDMFTVVDIKTTGDSTLSFSNKIKRFGYDFQMAFYCKMIEENIVFDFYNIEQPDPRMEKLRQMFKDQRSANINCFAYLLVESTTKLGYPLTFGIDWSSNELLTRIENAFKNYKYAKENPAEIYTKSFIDQKLVVLYENETQ